MSCLGFLSFFFCGTARHRRGKASESDVDKVKIRVGFEGKDTLFCPESLNVKTTFGQFAVLLDYADNRLVPLHSSGIAMEPLEPQRRYVVVLNTHGSSSHKWEDMRKQKGKGRKHRKHKREHKKKKSNKQSKSEKSANGSDECTKEPLIKKDPVVQVQVTNYITVDFGVSSSDMMTARQEVCAY